MWKGEAAILIIKEITTNQIRAVFIMFKFLKETAEKISSAEAIDWITKYFKILSLSINFVWEESFDREQNARVFISKAIQIVIQELSVKHDSEEKIKKIKNMGNLGILFFSNCKFDLFKN